MATDRFRAAPALAPLKAFQRRTVDYVFDRLYASENPTHRFLVADEVGLRPGAVAGGAVQGAVGFDGPHLGEAVGLLVVVPVPGGGGQRRPAFVLGGGLGGEGATGEGDEQQGGGEEWKVGKAASKSMMP